MYDELYAAWRLETENAELASLPQDFYQRTAEYLRKIKQENQRQEKGIKAILLEHELANASRMAKELIVTRYRKLLKILGAGKRVPADSLTSEEASFWSGAAPSAEAFSGFVDNVVQGKSAKMEMKTAPSEQEIVHKRVTLRFLKPIPSIIGSDMKSYGPFMVEDVASVPIENAKILVKQGLAKTIEVP